jgi:rubrerythrin
MGVSLEGFDPLAQGYSPLFQALQKLPSTIERLAAGQFTREAIAVRRNAMFIRYLERNGHAEVARLYQDQIQPDESHHHQLGLRGLERLIDSPEKLALARQAMALTLSIASEMKKAAQQRTGVRSVPGC